MILFDTDVAVDILRQRASAVQWWTSLDPALAAAVPGYVALELTDGCQNSTDLSALARFLRPLQIVWLSEDQSDRALQAYASIRLANAMDPFDILIAQTALLLGEPLHAFNQKHFNAVGGLRTVQPYER